MEKRKETAKAGGWSPRARTIAKAAGSLLLLLFPSLNAAGQDESFFPRISLAPLAAGLIQPVQVTHAGDGTGVLYVVEQGGRIRTLRDGTVGPVPFLDISDRVAAGGERGLLGLAFPEAYGTDGRFYVNYTRISDGATVIARYRTTGTPRVADPGSEEVLLVIPQPFANHNGGQIAFGPDGFLYVATGDGGSGGDPLNNAQNLSSLLGKILRIDVESGAVPYAIPPGNPFAGTEGAREEIWASGLRNPWRFSFDRLTGDLYIGDVGESSFEEVDFQPAASPGGENYGWNVWEGNLCFGGTGCDTVGFVPPVAAYDHSLGCSVTGGAVYRGAVHPSMEGIYFYADFCSGRIFGLAREGSTWRSAPLLTVPRSISSFGEDEEGNLFVTDYGGGSVHEIVAANAPPPAPVLRFPADAQTGLPATVVFRWDVSVDPDGEPVNYLFYLDTDPAFPGTVPVPAPAGTASRAGSGLPPLLPAAGFALAMIFSRSNRIRAAAAVLIVSAGVLVSSAPGCGGGGGGGGQVSAPGSISHEVSGLSPGTVYYWKVSAGDGTDRTESGTRNFATGSP